MTDHVTVYNPGAGPVVVDQAGRTLGGTEFGTVRRDRQPAKGLLESGQLLEVEHRDGPEVDERAGIAMKATDQANSNAASSPDDDEQPAKSTRRRAGSSQEA